MTNEEPDSVMAKTKEQFRKDEPLWGKNRAFHIMLENFLNTALGTEMDEHLVRNHQPYHRPRKAQNPV